MKSELEFSFSVKHWNKYFPIILKGSPRLHERESLVGSQECLSVLWGIGINVFINLAWLPRLARKRSSKMFDWCLSREGLKKSTAKKSSGWTSVLSPLSFSFNPWAYICWFQTNEKSCSQYWFIFNMLFLNNTRQWNRKKTQLYSILSIIKLCLQCCENICIHIFALKTNTCINTNST